MNLTGKGPLITLTQNQTTTGVPTYTADPANVYYGSQVVYTVPGGLYAAIATKTGANGAFSVTIEGSVDEQNWVTMATLNTSGQLVQIPQGVYFYVRANVGTLAAGDSVTVKLAIR